MIDIVQNVYQEAAWIPICGTTSIQ